MKWCVPALAIWLLLTLLLVEGQGRMNRGPVFSPIDWALIAAPPFGAYLTADTCRWRPLFFIYGCLGGTIFAVHYISGRAGRFNMFAPDPGVAGIFAMGILIIVAAGISCRLAAMRRHRISGSRFPAECCQECGYNLTGNVSGICSECGTAIPVEK
jgi:hypothetical protein